MMRTKIPHVDLTRIYGPNFHRIIGQISDDLWSGVPPDKARKRMLEEYNKLPVHPMRDELLMALERWFEVVLYNIPPKAPEQMKL